ncbi:hypothetical protein [Aneurinibacillus tyrosinisolvens]|nr:hypothetical protein [Aneurinibacillus tyrosinisolvens]
MNCLTWTPHAPIPGIRQERNLNDRLTVKRPVSATMNQLSLTKRDVL